MLGAVERRSMFNLLLWAPLVTHNPNLQVVIIHASHVCTLYSLHVFGLHKTQFDYTCLDLLSLEI